MNFELAEKIADAVLYEGYILYPYRPSAIKNRQRWTFGGIYPQAYSLAQWEMDPWNMQTECLLVGSQPTALDVRVRFLHLLWREVGELSVAGSTGASSSPWLLAHNGMEFRRVESLRVGQKVFHTWQEAVEREVHVPNLALYELAEQPYRFNFNFPASQSLEPLQEPHGEVMGIIRRQQPAIEGALEITAQQEKQGDNPLFKLTVRIMNITPLEQAEQQDRNQALLRAFVSTHTILSVHHGEFISLLDPPADYSYLAANCQNLGTYPVLVGAEGERDMLLSSPIILYDYPQIAPESAGDLFDGTEIDEILTLRILTMTDAEKEEARQTDEHARELLDRTEALTWDQLAKLHGTVRGIRAIGPDTA